MAKDEVSTTKYDFSGIGNLDIERKLILLEHLNGVGSTASLSPEEQRFFTLILSFRSENPRFLPEELDPINW